MPEPVSSWNFTDWSLIRAVTYLRRLASTCNIVRRFALFLTCLPVFLEDLPLLRLQHRCRGIGNLD